jgi:hypothetical protein
MKLAFAMLADSASVSGPHSTSSSAERMSLFLESVDSLLETLDILGDAALMASLECDMRESAEGKGQDLDDMFAELGW